MIFMETNIDSITAMLLRTYIQLKMVLNYVEKPEKNK